MRRWEARGAVGWRRRREAASRAEDWAGPAVAGPAAPLDRSTVRASTPPHREATWKRPASISSPERAAIVESASSTGRSTSIARSSRTRTFEAKRSKASSVASRVNFTSPCASHRHSSRLIYKKQPALSQSPPFQAITRCRSGNGGGEEHILYTRIGRVRFSRRVRHHMCSALLCSIRFRTSRWLPVLKTDWREIAIM